MPNLDTIIAEAVSRYEREYDRYLKLSARVADICRSEVVEGNAIRAQVTSRAKSSKSFDGKIRLIEKATPGFIKTVESVFNAVRDLAAVRVATYDKNDEVKVVQEIMKRFCGNAGGGVDVDRKDKHAANPGSFYRAAHSEVYLRPDELVGTYANLANTPCEVQVCSMMSHVWNEIEHDLGYKPLSGRLSEPEQELLGSLGHLSRTGDGIISQLLAATERRLREQTGAFEDVYDFVARLRKWFPSVELTNHAGQCFDELQQLGITTPQQVEELVGEARDVDARAQQALAILSEKLVAAGHDRYTLDPTSSDLLLASLLPKLAQQIVDNHPTGRGIGGPPRIAWIAARYLELANSMGTS
ncbi:MAG: hypothetical protein HYY84_12885 [Deltaproteobacteria bacterium]|nr:hypothetical protein [Deltaproteobacteria bacterium]